MKQLYAKTNASPGPEQTATVAELIAALQILPPDAPTAFEWEGQVIPVTVDRIELTEKPFLKEQTVILDADAYYGW